MPLTVLSVGFPLARVSPGTAGGAEQVLLTIDRELVRRGDHSLVVAAAGSRCSGLLVPVRIPSGELDANAKLQARRDFKEAIHRVLANYPVDLIHMHGLDFHDYLPQCDVPTIVTLHLPLAWYDRKAFQLCDRNVQLVAVSQAQAKSSPPNVRIDAIIPNGVELDDYCPRDRKGNYALIMSRICLEKGIDLALDAAAEANVPVILAGAVFDYPEHREYFERSVRPRLNQSIRFVGAVGGSRKSYLLAGARCLLLASQVDETSSLVAMEALASGTPVIAWRKGALEEIVIDGETGWLVTSVREMAEAIGRANVIDAAACRYEAERRFSSGRMASAYLDLYRRSTAGEMSQELQVA
jgi:glycosyltransferase involved in cell wall biosynthesis